MAERSFKQPSVMTSQQHFSGAPQADVPRSTFDRSHAYKTTFDAGYLIPVFCDEVLPGDTFDVKTTMFTRLATPQKPIMDNIYQDIHFFFVPNRLIWDHWENFMGERDDPDDDPTIYTVPQGLSNFSAHTAGSLRNYFGLPYRASGSISVSMLPFRAYNLIYNEWYRDQNLQDRVPVVTADSGDSWASYNLLRRGKRHDYFTSCLPWPQKGDPVVVPIGDQAPVLTSTSDTVSGAQSTLFWNKASDGTNATPGDLGINASNLTVVSGAASGGTEQVYPSNLYADLAAATSISVNDLRTAFQIQRLLERDARGGTRYIELILSHFGVRSPDGRLQRPEFLGGGTTRVNINPIASTVDDASVPQGNLAGVGTSVGTGGFTKSFTEHGYIIGIASARADLTYQQGIERSWFRETRYDYYWPALAHLGEQAVLTREIYAQGTAVDDTVFGYQERYAEYRYKPSRITGLFQSDVPSSLDVWHLSQDFATVPVLNSSFIQEDPPIDRVIAVPAEPHFLADFWFDMKCTRPMPVYAVPGLIDHL